MMILSVKQMNLFLGWFHIPLFVMGKGHLSKVNRGLFKEYLLKNPADIIEIGKEHEV